jgi:hypothetical protein
LLANAVCQAHQYRLTHCIREQARSHSSLWCSEATNCSYTLANL